jgi:hypothetical protein
MVRDHGPPRMSGWSRILLLHATMGAFLDVIVGAAILATDVFPAGTLFWHSNAPIAASALYFLSFASTFAAGSTATAIMGSGREEAVGDAGAPKDALIVLFAIAWRNGAGFTVTRGGESRNASK